MGKKVFILGGAASIWIKEYIKNIHYKEGNEVWIALFEKPPAAYFEEYEKMGVHILDLSEKTGTAGNFYKTAGLIQFALKHRKCFFDHIEIHCPPSSRQADIFAVAAKIIAVKTIVVFWGSDILRINDSQARQIKKIVDIADQINLSTGEMRKAFRHFFGNKYDTKISSANFGSLAFEEIRKAKEGKSKNKLKGGFGLDPDRISVAVGYNGSQKQQHLKVIQALGRMDESSKNRIELMLHVPDCTFSYMDELRAALTASGISYIIMDEMISLERIAELRCAMDIFIHAQVTDALSSTIREYIYAGTDLINPVWIRYDEFDRLGIEYCRYDDFDMLEECLKKLIDGEIRIDSERNSEIIYRNYSWDTVRNEWLDIYVS